MPPRPVTMKLIAVSVLAAISGILLFLLASASANTTLFARNYLMLLAANGVAHGDPGGAGRLPDPQALAGAQGSAVRLPTRLRLVAMFAMMAIVPGVLIYSVSFAVRDQGIDSWFDVGRHPHSSAIALGRGSLDYLLDQLEARPTPSPRGLADGEALRPVRLNRLREQVGADAALIFTASGDIVATSNIGRPACCPTSLRPVSCATCARPPTPAGRKRRGRPAAPAHRRRTAQPAVARRSLLPSSYWAASPNASRTIASTVRDAYQDYQQLALGRAGRQIYTLTLTLTLLLALFAAAARQPFRRRLSAPLRHPRRGHPGDLRRRLLAASGVAGARRTRCADPVNFQPDDPTARRRPRTGRAQPRRGRGLPVAYLEACWPTSPPACSPSPPTAPCARRTPARPASSATGWRVASSSRWPNGPTTRTSAMPSSGLCRKRRGLARADRDQRREWPQQTLLMHGSRLPHATDGGWVVVFDDISLISAQRTAAWAEIARRVAHEIKNPLTPIQLSAERLEHRLSGQLDEAGKAMLSRSTRTIVNQVEAMKNLVNAFRDYAKLPAPGTPRRSTSTPWSGKLPRCTSLPDLACCRNLIATCPSFWATRASCARSSTTCCRMPGMQSPKWPAAGEGDHPPRRRASGVAGP